MSQSIANLGKLLGPVILLVVTAGVLSAVVSRAEAPGREHHVVITNFAFEPAVVDAKAGDTIIWTNRDIAPHTATSDDGSWDTGTLSKDESMSVVVGADMKASYFCQFHPNMKGSVAFVTD